MIVNKRPTLIQGNHHSFHADAAVKMGIERSACLPMDTHSELYEVLRTNQADDAVVAVVNSSIGRIIGSYEELLHGDHMVVDRVDLPIVFGLYGLPDATKDDITTVHTQSHAYKQCADMLAQYLPRASWREEQDTAGSAVIVAKLGNKSHAAICSKQAGEAAGLSCLYEALQDDKDNHTTFYRVSKRNNHSRKDTNIAVAVLHTEDYDLAETMLRNSSIPMQPLHIHETKNQRLIVEIQTTDHRKTLQQASQALGSVGTLHYLGGYTARTPGNRTLAQD